MHDSQTVGIEKEKPFVIPTRSKSKIPHVLSYPIGAERMTAVLGDIPQLHEVALRFYFWNDSSLRRGDYEFLRVEYHNHYQSTEWTKFGLYKRIEQYRWEIVVQPVPRLFRHKVSTEILANAMDQIRAWFIGHAGMKQEGSDILAFFYDEKKDEFYKEEQTRLEPKRI